MRKGDEIVIVFGNEAVTLKVTNVQRLATAPPTGPSPAEASAREVDAVKGARANAQAVSAQRQTAKATATATATAKRHAIGKPARWTDTNELVEPPSEIKLGRRTVRVGDEVRVLPSQPGKRDGYIAVVRGVNSDGSVTVVAAKRQDPGKVIKGSMGGTRSYPLTRLKAMNKRKDT